VRQVDVLPDLTYEHQYYEKIKKNLPKIGKKVRTKDGEGKIVRQNVLKETLTIALESGDEIELSARDLMRQSRFKKKSKRSNH
jgi:cell fate regulator YaaT (PSP1 superfamily)